MKSYKGKTVDGQKAFLLSRFVPTQKYNPSQKELLSVYAVAVLDVISEKVKTENADPNVNVLLRRVIEKMRRRRVKVDERNHSRERENLPSSTERYYKSNGDSGHSRRPENTQRPRSSITTKRGAQNLVTSPLGKFEEKHASAASSSSAAAADPSRKSKNPKKFNGGNKTRKRKRKSIK